MKEHIKPCNCKTCADNISRITKYIEECCDGAVKQKLAEQKKEIMEYARDTIPVTYKEKLFRRFNYE